MKLEVRGFNFCLSEAEGIVKKYNGTYLLNFQLYFKGQFVIQNTELTRVIQCEDNFVHLNNSVHYSTIRIHLDQIYMS